MNIKFLTTEELAKILNCAPTTIYDMVADGLPHMSLRKQTKRKDYRFDLDEVKSFIQEKNTIARDVS